MRDTALGAFGLGWFSDVAFLGGALYLSGGFDVPGGVELRVYVLDPHDVRTGTVVFRERLVEGYGYSRLYAYRGNLCLAFHTGRVGRLWIDGVDDMPGPAIIDPCEGSSPVCFGAGALAWQGAQADGWPVRVLPLDGNPLPQRPVVRQGQGTGLSRIADMGQVITVDEDRLTLAGTTIPCFAGDLAVGEGPDGGTVWQLGAGADAVRGVFWPGTFTGTPRCAVSAADALVAICTGGGPGVRVFCGTPSELLETQGVPPIKKPDDPPDDGDDSKDPDDPKKPGDKPMEPMAPRPIEVVRDVFTQYGERFSPGNDETRGTLVDIVVHRLRKRGDVHAKRWGRKLKSDGHTLNTDTATYDRGDGFFEIYDIVSGGTFDSPVKYACWNDAEGGPIFKIGANGSWTLPQLRDTDEEPDGGPVDHGGDDPPVTDTGLAARVTALEAGLAHERDERMAQGQVITELVAIIGDDKLANVVRYDDMVAIDLTNKRTGLDLYHSHRLAVDGQLNRRQATARVTRPAAKENRVKARKALAKLIEKEVAK